MRLHVFASASLALLLGAACSPQSTSLRQDHPISRQAEMLTCVRENGYAMLAAHRGGPAPGYPENAMSSLRRLTELGVLYAEIDVRVTRDGELVLLHDETLDRTTTGRGLLAEQSWADLASLSLRDPDGEPTQDHIPRLSEALDFARETGLVLNLDLKTVSAERIFEEISAHQARDHVAIIAYTVEAAAEWHALDNGLVLSVPDALPELTEAGVNPASIYVWLGTGPLDAARDQELADLGVESSVGLFRREDGTAAPYLEAAQAGVELLSIDQVDTAVSALGGAEEMHRQIANCTPDA